jgi:hypothetical protein
MGMKAAYQGPRGRFFFTSRPKWIKQLTWRPWKKLFTWRHVDEADYLKPWEEAVYLETNG